MQDNAGDIVVGTATGILSGVGHLAAPYGQYADQGRRLGLPGDDEARLGVRGDQSPVLEPVHVQRRAAASGRVTDQLDRTAPSHQFAARHPDHCSIINIIINLPTSQSSVI